jgi:ribose 5-phosphate isomerase A
MDKEAGKKAASEAAVRLVQDGMVLGIGSGTTANHFQAALAERIQKEGLRVQAVSPSVRSEQHAAAIGIPMVPLSRGLVLDLAVDGADEVADDFSLIKGGGGALIREKLVVAAAREFIVVADDSKAVGTLGAFPLPVAIIPFAWEQTVDRIAAAFPVPITMRGGNDNLFVSDDGLYIADLHFGTIPDPAETHARLRSIYGVADCGLFVHLAHRVLLGSPEGQVREMTKRI